MAVHEFFRDLDYTLVTTPILTSNDCEGAGETFRVTPENSDTSRAMVPKEHPEMALDEAYFNTKCYLTVSAQLHLEALAHALCKVYTLGPTFRAENSKSRLHLSEFYMLETEVAFIDDLTVLLQFVEHLLKTVSKKILDVRMEDVLKCSNATAEELNFNWLERPFQVVTYAEATNILGGRFANKEDEFNLVKHFDSVPTFVINWPHDKKPFYMRNCTDNSDNVAAFDLIGPVVGEIVGGGLRENNYDRLKTKLREEHHLKWYLDLRRYGGVPTGGFGLGFERYLQFLLKLPNIKDVIPFPRWPHNCSL